MKQMIITNLLLASFLGNATEIDIFKVNHFAVEKTIVHDSLLMNIQTKIIDAFIVSLRTKKNRNLLKIKDELENLYTKNKQPLILYWISYSQYFISLSFLVQRDKNRSEKEIDKGIALLESMDNKNSEDYVLLALSQNFSTQFKRMKVVSISEKVRENANKAIALDSTNLRAYYVLGNNDFYTPKMFGGGTKTEEYLKKAISLPSQKIKNPYLPSWGKDDAYEYLIRFYIREKRWEDAEKYYQKGIKLYPNRYAINKLGDDIKP